MDLDIELHEDYSQLSPTPTLLLPALPLLPPLPLLLLPLPLPLLLLLLLPGYEGVVEGTRLCARALYSGAACGADSHPGGGNTTPGKLELCSANAGVSSNGPSLWHTFAHEIAHGLGGGHTFGDGGLLESNLNPNSNP